MENEYGREHSEHVAQADHRISHAERESLEDVHPQNRATCVAKTAAKEPPIDKQTSEERPCPFKAAHLLKGELEKHLTSGKKEALDDGQCQQSHIGL